MFVIIIEFPSICNVIPITSHITKCDIILNHTHIIASDREIDNLRFKRHIQFLKFWKSVHSPQKLAKLYHQIGSLKKNHAIKKNYFFPQNCILRTWILEFVNVKILRKLYFYVLASFRLCSWQSWNGMLILTILNENFIKIKFSNEI